MVQLLLLSSPGPTPSDIISIKYTPVQEGGAYFDDRIARDYLNIECKAASHNTAAGWRDVIMEATEYRLARYGTWMCFYVSELADSSCFLCGVQTLRYRTLYGCRAAVGDKNSISASAQLGDRG